ncbi:NADPH-dependent 7-cyano-7-deazaguanine reductase QueF [Echinimonas agarilytica]|uniref:NADPH-dependent 7-cyano-7-deazaguanine reductase n=1 Tax=Echinimonas agarilytica TaxID=1215918 RepID=A0AA41W568_9GAMM|nr:NADPH-dependent 7-cyano-7-deazaguanine reductase QueF [Echinimonas agarilytica]MCM2679111.1 NADPH-dependent 7-cyano-7-deazaguanine reductase QueF [Echinimonas agarilytica]
MPKYDTAPELEGLTLGQQTSYPDHYDATQLQAVPRTLNRDDIGISADALPFDGHDDWTGYEISWLNSKGKPCVAIGLFRIPCESDNLIESKSFKLYLNSFNQSRFESVEHVSDLMARDLSQCAKAPVSVELLQSEQFGMLPMKNLQGECIDDLDIEVTDFQFCAEYLENSVEPDGTIEEHFVVSHLLKSNCLITGQPDWGSVQIRYTGLPINQEKLLRYLISFRQHNEFHEQCVERIYTDIMRFCAPKLLTVQARYTRRGGLDINPFRSNFESMPAAFRMVRQ